MRVASLQAGVLVLSLAAISCGIPDEYARTWEGNHGGKFLPGYSDSRGEDDGTDNGYVIMSYTLPAAVPAAQAVSLIRAQVQTQTPCYGVITETTSTLVLRCPGGAPRGSMMDEEYSFRVEPKTRRVYVLVIDRVQNGKHDDEVRRSFFESRGRESTVLQMKIYLELLG